MSGLFGGGWLFQQGIILCVQLIFIVQLLVYCGEELILWTALGVVKNSDSWPVLFGDGWQGIIFYYLCATCFIVQLLMWQWTLMSVLGCALILYISGLFCVGWVFQQGIILYCFVCNLLFHCIAVCCLSINARSLGFGLKWLKGLSKFYFYICICMVVWVLDYVAVFRCFFFFVSYRWLKHVASDYRELVHPIGPGPVGLTGTAAGPLYWAGQSCERCCVDCTLCRLASFPPLSVFLLQTWCGFCVIGLTWSRRRSF